MKIADNISWKSLLDKVVAVDTATGVYYTLNETASDMWKALADGADFDAIVAKMKEEYADADAAELEKDVRDQLDEWLRNKLVVE